MCISLVRPHRAMAPSAAALLERELAANTFDDGLNRELATDYHRFVLELGLLAAVEADAIGQPLSAVTWERLARMLDAGAAILDATGRAPRQGDDDEGRALIVDDPERDPWATILSAGAALLGAPGWWPDFAGSVQGSLLGALGRSRQMPRPSERPRRFPDAGLVLLTLAHRMVPKSGADAMAAPMDSCPSRPMPMPMPCPWRCDTTVSISLPTPAPTATTVSPCGESGSARRQPTTLSRSAVKPVRVGWSVSLEHPRRTSTLTCEVGEARCETWSAEARRVPALAYSNNAPSFGDVGLSGADS